MKHIFIVVMCVGHVPLAVFSASDNDTERDGRDLSVLQNAATGPQLRAGIVLGFPESEATQRKRSHTDLEWYRAQVESGDDISERIGQERRIRRRLAGASSIVLEHSSSPSDGEDCSDSTESLSLLEAAQEYAVVLQDKARVSGFIEEVRQVVSHAMSVPSSLLSLVASKQEDVEAYKHEQIRLLAFMQNIVSRELVILQSDLGGGALS